MRLGWKVLIPIAIVWIMIVATFRTVTDEVSDRTPWIIGIAIGIGVVFVIMLIDPGGRARREREEAAEQEKIASAPSLDAIPWPPVTVESPKVLAGAVSGARSGPPSWPTTPPPSAPWSATPTSAPPTSAPPTSPPPETPSSPTTPGAEDDR
jgi:NADH-quinone oxidoreductase subunit H